MNPLKQGSWSILTRIKQGKSNGNVEGLCLQVHCLGWCQYNILFVQGVFLNIYFVLPWKITMKLTIWGEYMFFSRTFQASFTSKIQGEGLSITSWGISGKVFKMKPAGTVGPKTSEINKWEPPGRVGKDPQFYLFIFDHSKRRPSLRIMGSQNWWFGDGKPLLYTSKPLYSRVQWFLGLRINPSFLAFFFRGKETCAKTSPDRFRWRKHSHICLLKSITVRKPWRCCSL